MIRTHTGTPEESRKLRLHIRIHPDNINRDNRIEIPEVWIPTIKKHNETPVQQQTTKETTWSQTSWKTRTNHNNGDQNPPMALDHHDTNDED